MGFEQELADESASSSPPPYSPDIDTLTTGSGYVQSD